MRFRPLTSTGDMRPVGYASEMWTDTDAVAAAVRSRMDLAVGEWWEDETVGFELPDFLMRGIRGNADCQMMVNYILAYIQKTPGVVGISSATYKVVGRECYIDLTVETEFGGFVERRLNLDELLSAVSG